MHHNPFATRYTATGKIPFLPPCEIDLRTVCDQFIDADFVGQICGPHGSGKTTMALAIEHLLDQHFASTRHFVIRKKSSFIFSGVEVNSTLGARRREQVEAADFEQTSIGPQLWNTTAGIGQIVDRQSEERELLVIDGWENASVMDQYKIRSYCQQTNSGLLLTTHRRHRSIPLLYQMRPNFGLFISIVRELQRESLIELSGGAVRKAYDCAQGNFREAFMTLYDEYHQRQHKYVNS